MKMLTNNGKQLFYEFIMYQWLGYPVVKKKIIKSSRQFYEDYGDIYSRFYT